MNYSTKKRQARIKDMGIASWEQIIHLTSIRSLTVRSGAFSRGTNCCKQKTPKSSLAGESSYLNSHGEWLVYVLN